MIANKHHPVYKDDDVPKWKKDLMQRRKNLSKTIVSGGGLVKLRVTCPVNMVKTVSTKLIEQNQINSQQQSVPEVKSSNSGKINDNSIQKADITTICLDESNVQHFLENNTKQVENKHLNVNIKLKINDKDYHSDSSEEFEDKANNINAIKDKLLTRCSSPPPVTNLERKAISFEDILDLDSTRLKPKYNINRGSGSLKINQYQAKYLELVNASRNNINSGSKINNTEISEANDIKNKNFVKERAKMFEKNQIEIVQKPPIKRTNTYHKKRPISFKGTGTGFSFSEKGTEQDIISKEIQEEVTPITEKEPKRIKDLTIYSKFIESNIPSEFEYKPQNTQKTVITTWL